MNDVEVKVGELPSLQSRLQGLAGDADLTGVELLRRVCGAANLYDTIVNQLLRASHLSGQRWHLLVCLLAEEMRHGPGGLSPRYLSECQTAVESIRRLKLKSPLRGWQAAQEPVPEGTFQLQTGISILGIVFAPRLNYTPRTGVYQGFSKVVAA